MQTYYNTNNEVGTTLLTSNKKAKKQEDVILDFFKRNKGQAYTPYEVLVFCYPKHPHFEGFEVPLTSIRRAITNLTSEGVLEKTGLMKECQYGKFVHTWKFIDNEYEKCEAILIDNQ